MSICSVAISPRGTITLDQIQAGVDGPLVGGADAFCDFARRASRYRRLLGFHEPVGLQKIKKIEIKAEDPLVDLESHHLNRRVVDGSTYKRKHDYGLYEGVD